MNFKKILPIVAIALASAVLLGSCTDNSSSEHSESSTNGSISSPSTPDGDDEVYSPVSSIVNGTRWKDTDGNYIQAHGGQVQKLSYVDRDGKAVSKFWWIGENKDGMTNYADQTNNGVNAYSSDDLLNWTFEGTVMQTPKTMADMENEYYTDLYSTAEQREFVFNLTRQDGGILERPKLLYNEKTQKYVMWFHSDTYDIDTPDKNYRFSQASVATADHPWGPYKIENSYRMYCDKDNYLTDDQEGTVRDMTAYKDDDGKAYLFYSSDWNTTMYIGLLDENYTAPAVDPANAVYGTHYITVRINDNSREAPAVAKIKGKYYMLTSGCDAWTPSTTLSYTADSLLGEWTSDGDAFVNDTKANSFHSQSTCLFFTGKEWVYMGDRWNNNGGVNLDTQLSTYVWLPLSVENGKVEVTATDSWVPSVDITTEVPSFTDIQIDAESAKKLYKLGEKFTFDGITVTEKDKNGKNRTLTKEEFGVKVPDLSKLGAHTVTVYYGATETEYGVYVYDGSLGSGYCFDMDRLQRIFYINDQLTALSEYIYHYGENGVQRVTNCTVEADTSREGKTVATFTMPDRSTLSLDILVAPNTTLKNDSIAFESKTHKNFNLQLIVTSRVTDQTTQNVKTSGYYILSSDNSFDVYDFDFSYTQEGWKSEFNTEGLQETISESGLSDSGGLYVVAQGKQFYATPFTWHAVILGW